MKPLDLAASVVDGGQRVGALVLALPLANAGVAKSSSHNCFEGRVHPRGVGRASAVVNAPVLLSSPSRRLSLALNFPAFSASKRRDERDPNRRPSPLLSPPTRTPPVSMSDVNASMRSAMKPSSSSESIGG